MTFQATLLRKKGSYFDNMLESGDCQPDANGAYFIDADPKHFDRILHFLRTGKLRFKGLEEPEQVLLKDSLEFFF